MISCAANAIECDGVVYCCANARVVVLSAIGSFKVWISWMVGGFVESMLDRLRLVIGYWSPLELIATWVFFRIVSNLCCTTPLEVMAFFFSWTPLEVGVGYCACASACLGMTDVGCGNTLFTSGVKDSTVLQFDEIDWTASIAANCELHMLVGTSFSAADKRWMAWVIMSSAVT